MTDHVRSRRYILQSGDILLSYCVDNILRFTEMEYSMNHPSLDKAKTEYVMHYSVACFGGFLGAYSLINHHELFGNAQTSNLIHIAICLAGSNFHEFSLRLFDLVLYFLGFACTVFIPRYTKWNLHYCSVFLNLCTVWILYLMPRGFNDYIFLAPVFFAMSFQWNSFKGAGGYVSSTIFSTNNFRQFTTSFCEYLCDRDRSHLHKTRFFGGTLLSFHTGVLLAYLVSRVFGLDGVLFGLLPVAISFTAIAVHHDLPYIVWRRHAAWYRLRIWQLGKLHWAFSPSKKDF